MIAYYALSTFYVVTCLILLLVILLQQGKGDMAAAFGGGSSQSAFGARAPARCCRRRRRSSLYCSCSARWRCRSWAAAAQLGGERNAGAAAPKLLTAPATPGATTTPAPSERRLSPGHCAHRCAAAE